MILLTNKKAKFEYDIGKTYITGVILSGSEVKSLRQKSGSLKGSFVKAIGGELFLLNAQISPYKFSDNKDYDPKRTRKLLLKKKEIDQLIEADSQQGRTIVPLQFELQHNKIKLKIGIGRGLKLHDKRAKLKKRTLDRETQKELKRL
jgi:SsrA-binding protein